jgi:hypothetical protein
MIPLRGSRVPRLCAVSGAPASSRAWRRPAAGIDREIGIGRVAEEARDRDVGKPDLAEQPALFGQFALQIVERPGNILRESLLDPRLIARLAPDRGMDALLVEQAPDEDVAEAGVGIFLEPAGAGAVGGRRGEQRRFGKGLVQPGADHAAVGQHQLLVDQHRDSSQRRQSLELRTAEEGRDRIDLVGEPLQRQASGDLADIGADIAADDLHISLPIIRGGV